MILAHTDAYLGKKLAMKAGTAGGLQYHVEKEETFHLFEGRAEVETTTCDGELVKYPMEEGETYHVPPGAIHRVTAITDCILFEWSTPVFDDRVRVEEDFGETIDGGLPTTKERV